jgi:hypothetical protein
MPVNYKTASQAELDIERAAVNLSLHKQTADSSWSKITKSVASDLLNVKTEMEDLYRLLTSADLAALTGQQKADFLLKLNSSTSKITTAFQVHFIALSDSPSIPQKFIQQDAFTGLSPEQSKKISELRKKREDQSEKDELKAEKAQKQSFYDPNRRKPFYNMFVPKPRGFPNQMIYPQFPQMQNSSPNMNLSTPPPPLSFPLPGMFYNASSSYPATPTSMPALTYTSDREKKRQMIEQEKLNSYCKDCNKLGHWKGDAQCQFAALRLAGYMLHN